MNLPLSRQAPEGQTDTHFPQPRQREASYSPRGPRAPPGHTAQAPQCRQRFGSTMAWGLGFCVSGLWHQRQRNGQPLKKTLVRIPGPSLTEKGIISVITPRIAQ